MLIADDRPLYRLALIQAARSVMPDSVLDEAEDLPGVHRMSAVHADIDLVLLKRHTPGSHGLMWLGSLRTEHPGVAVVMISAHGDPVTIRRALAYGAAGNLTTRADLAELHADLRAVVNCEEWLPPNLRETVARSPPRRQRKRQRRARHRLDRSSSRRSSSRRSRMSPVAD